MSSGVSGTKGPSAKAAPVNNLKPIGEQEPFSLSGPIGEKDWIKQNTDVDPGKIEATHKALKHFTGSGSSGIRADQKNNVKNAEGELLEEYIKKAPQWDNSHDLHRGMSLSKADLDKMIATQGTKKTIDINNSGTASWSTKYAKSESFAYAYGDEVPVMFRTKSMKNATPVMHLSSIKSEMEVFSSKDNRFRIKKVAHKKINGKPGYLIDVEQA